MQCQTILAGNECTFMGKNGCTYPNGSCQVVVENCEGCDRIVAGSIGSVCNTYPAPEKKWLNGICNFATHVKVEIKTEETKVNPLKASKKASGGKKK